MPLRVITPARNVISQVLNAGRARAALQSRGKASTPAPVPPPAELTSSDDPVPSKIARVSALPSSTKALNRLLGSTKRFELLEKDLDETFVRGSGKGGQAINKLATSVSLIHKPTGLRVQCQPTRSLEKNRRSARKLLAEKLATLDEESAAPSRQEILIAKKQLQAARARKRSAKKYGQGAGDRIAGWIEAPAASGTSDGGDEVAGGEAGFEPPSSDEHASK